MANADRISELYKGEIWDEAVQRRARDRIHWLCRQAHGVVLDVGCSQGIASLLLAREGLRSIGVDVEIDRLQYAENDKNEEDSTVSQNVHFVGANGAQLPFSDDSFNTILLGELLEHLVNPQSVLAEVARVLRPDGTVAITVPFGYHPHHDHKASFYPHSILELLAEHLTPKELEIEDGYMRLVASSRDPDAVNAARDLVWRHQVELEKAFLITEQSLGDSRRRVQQLEHQVRETHDQLRKSKRLMQRHEKHIEQLQSANTAASQQIEQLEAANTEANQQIDRLQAANKDANQQIDRLQAARAEAKEHLQLIGAEAQRTKTRLERETKLTAAQLARIQNLERDKHLLRHRLDVANWKLSSIRGRKWWRLGQVLRDAAKRPHRIFLLPAELAKVAFKPSRLPPKPVEEPFIPSESARETPQARPSTATKGQKAGRLSPTQEVAEPQSSATVVGPGELTWPPGIRSEPRDPGDLWVASIMDEMSHACFDPECNVVSFRPDNWRQVLDGVRPHFLFVESAWTGNSGSWQYKIASYRHPDHMGLPDLKALLEWCEQRGIPTVFWNKEDPVHFDRFKEAAALFDFVFTSDADSVHRYEQLPQLRAQKVDTLQFAAQPKLHNPISISRSRSDEPVFAGTYYRTRHEDRRHQLEMILDAARPYGLIIYDRTHGLQSDEVGFPERFQQHIVGRLPYDELVREYKNHKIFLNTNSVTKSSTMFSRRVFELLASGTAVVSTPSKGMESTFGNLIPIVNDEEQARHTIERLIKDDSYRNALTREGTRFVLANHTYRERLAQVANAIGYDVDPRKDERFSLLLLADDWEAMEPLIEDISKQTKPPDQVLIGAQSPEAGHRIAEAIKQLNQSEDIRVVHQRQEEIESSASRYRELAALASHEWIGFMSAGHRHDATFLEDLVLATKFTSADVIGSPLQAIADRRYEGTVSDEYRENRFVDVVAPLACLARRDVVLSREWPLDAKSAQLTMPTWQSEGVQIYATNGHELSTA